jgi:hypothetical protein
MTLARAVLKLVPRDAPCARKNGAWTCCARARLFQGSCRAMCGERKIGSEGVRR